MSDCRPALEICVCRTTDIWPQGMGGISRRPSTERSLAWQAQRIASEAIRELKSLGCRASIEGMALAKGIKLALKKIDEGHARLAYEARRTEQEDAK